MDFFKRHTLKGGGGLNVCKQSVVFKSQTCKEEKKKNMPHDHEHKRKQDTCHMLSN
jgi:hypothetical protein